MRPNVAAALRWPPGMALITWRYVWDTTPLHRHEEPGDARDLPPRLPDAVAEDLSPPAGSGPLYHRRFQVRILDARIAAADLIAMLSDDLNQALPSEAVHADFDRRRPGTLRRGDRVLVRMPGPWNGPVRVVDRGATSFRFATLQGHLEAGQIEFRAADRDGAVEFTIEAWARPAGRLVDVLYTRLRLAKEIQLNMWVRFCTATADLAGGRLDDGVTILTRRLEDPDRAATLAG